MSEETTAISGNWKAIVGALVSVAVGVALGFVGRGEPPNAIEITCASAAAILESDACAQDDPPAPDEAPATIE